MDGKSVIKPYVFKNDDNNEGDGVNDIFTTKTANLNLKNSVVSIQNGIPQILQTVVKHTLCGGSCGGGITFD